MSAVEQVAFVLAPFVLGVVVGFVLNASANVTAMVRQKVSE